MDLYFSEGYWRDVKRKQPRSVYELVSPIPFPTTTTITLSMPHYTWNFYKVVLNIAVRNGSNSCFQKWKV